MAEVKLSNLCVELRDVDWKSLGVHLGISLDKVHTIQEQYPHNKNQCLMELMHYWTINGDCVSWAAIAVALKKMFQEPLAKTITRRYCSNGCGLVETDGDGGECKSIEVHKNVHDELMQLNLHYSSTIQSIKRIILQRLNRSLLRRNRIIARENFIVFVATFLNKETQRFKFDEIFDELCKANDIFKVEIFRLIIRHYFSTSPIKLGIEIIEAYECKLQSFLKTTLISQLKDKVIEVVPPPIVHKCDTLSIVLSNEWNTIAWNLLEKLMKKVFGIHDNVLIRSMVTTGSIIVKWQFRCDHSMVLKDLVTNNSDILNNSAVIQLLVGDEIVFSQDTYNEVVVMDEKLKFVEMSLHPDNQIRIAPMGNNNKPTITVEDRKFVHSLINPEIVVESSIELVDDTHTTNHPLVYERSSSYTTIDEYCSLTYDCALGSDNSYLFDYDNKHETDEVTEQNKNNL